MQVALPHDQYEQLVQLMLGLAAGLLLLPALRWTPLLKESRALIARGDAPHPICRAPAGAPRQAACGGIYMPSICLGLALAVARAKFCSRSTKVRTRTWAIQV